MFPDGSVKDNLNFKTICRLKQKEQNTRITFQNGYDIAVYSGELLMEQWFEYSIKYALLRVGGYSRVCHLWEIYKLLFINLNINPDWIESKLYPITENHFKVFFITF